MGPSTNYINVGAIRNMDIAYIPTSAVKVDVGGDAWVDPSAEIRHAPSGEHTVRIRRDGGEMVVDPDTWQLGNDEIDFLRSVPEEFLPVEFGKF